MYENEVSLTDPAELFHCYGPPIFSYLRLHASSREEAEDLTHDVFAVALGNPQLLTWSGPRQLGWLRRVAANKLSDSYRRANRRPAITLDQIVETLFDEHDPELVAQRSEDYSQLHHLSVSEAEVGDGAIQEGTIDIIAASYSARSFLGMNEPIPIFCATKGKRYTHL